MLRTIRAQKRWKFVSAVACIVAAGGAAAIVGARKSSPAVVSPVLIEIEGARVREAVAHADTVPVPNAVAAIVPHHFLARTLIARCIKSVSGARPKTIVVVGPDHADAGTSLITTIDANVVGAGSPYRTNIDIVRRLVNDVSVQTQNEAIAREHSVMTLYPFLANWFSAVTYVPISLRSNTEPAVAQQLGRALHEMLAPGDLVIASVDFSHYRLHEDALRDDAVSIAALQAPGTEQLADIPADSPASIIVAATYADLRGATQRTLIDHATSSELLHDQFITETTSYLTWVFSVPHGS